MGGTALKSYEKVCGRLPDTTLSPLVWGGLGRGWEVESGIKSGLADTPTLSPQQTQQQSIRLLGIGLKVFSFQGTHKKSQHEDIMCVFFSLAGLIKVLQNVPM